LYYDTACVFIVLGCGENRGFTKTRM